VAAAVPHAASEFHNGRSKDDRSIPNEDTSCRGSSDGSIHEDGCCDRHVRCAYKHTNTARGHAYGNANYAGHGHVSTGNGDANINTYAHSDRNRHCVC
jgi:hypothetical protein